VPRPKKPDELQTVPVSVRLLRTGLASVDEIVTERGTDRTEVVKMLLGLGLASWRAGRRPPVVR
jgi:hypothetical protein